MYFIFVNCLITSFFNTQDNISDLKAQIAANQKGIQLVSELIDSYGLDVVQAYMGFIQKNAEVGVREMLKEIGREVEARTGRSVLEAEDFMDDGSRIKLKVEIDNELGSAVLDFSGTGPQVRTYMYSRNEGFILSFLRSFRDLAFD